MKLRLPALNFRTLFWGGIGLVILIGLFWAFRPSPVLVDAAAAGRGELVVSVQDEGRARVRDVYILSAPAAGRLARVEKRAGDSVMAGEAAAYLLPPASSFLDPRTEAQAQAALAAAADRVRQAQADRELAATEAARIEALAADGFAALAVRDRARRDLQAAEAGLSAARAERDRAAAAMAAPEGGAEAGPLAVRAPVSGRVLRVVQESETVIAPGAPIMEIGDPRNLEIVAEFLSSEAARITDGAAVSIRDWGGQPDPLPGRVRLVEPYGFTKISALGVEEQRVNVIVDLQDPAAASAAGLGHGWRVDVAVETVRIEDAVLAPVSALFRVDGGWAVFRMEDGRARLTPVDVGQNDGVQAEILSGLESGQTIVLYPGEQISDGVRVRAR